MEKYYRVSDVNEILNKLAKEPAYYHDGEDFYNGVCAIEGELMCLEPVELEEPKVGEWKFTEPDTHGNKKPYCSNCGEYHLSSWSDYTGCSYCPNCGAKMNKEN
jgi:hypothetical protein